MLEVVFSENAAGSLAAAMGKKGGKGCREALAAKNGGYELNGPGQPALAGSREDICSFPLYLGFGEIDEAGIGPLRERAVSALTGAYPAEGAHAAQAFLQTARSSLEKLLSRARQGEPLRIWASGQPDDACGLCWLMEQLMDAGLEQLDAALVLLPSFCEKPGGTAVLHSGWGELSAQEWSRMAGLGQKIPAALGQAMAACWQQLRAQNAPLRAVVSGRLVGVHYGFYDFLILRELETEPEEFLEARLIGKLLGKYPLGLSDAFFALRLEQFVLDGALQEVSSPAPGEPAYHRVLRRTSAGQQKIEK